MGQRDIAYDRGARGSDCVFDLRTLQVLTIRVLDGHSPCDFVGVGVIRTVFRDASLKFGFHRLPSGVIGTRFIQEFNGTVTGGIVFGYLNTIGQLIFLASLQCFQISNMEGGFAIGGGCKLVGVTVYRDLFFAFIDLDQLKAALVIFTGDRGVVLELVQNFNWFAPAILRRDGDRVFNVGDAVLHNGSSAFLFNGKIARQLDNKIQVGGEMDLRAFPAAGCGFL